MLEKAIGWIRSLTEAGLALIALGVVMQILFGAAVPFIGLDVVGSVVSLVKATWRRRSCRSSRNLGFVGYLH